MADGRTPSQPDSPSLSLGIPVYNPGAHVLRREALDAIGKRWRGGRKALLIEAQAGQGKSTLALQFLNEAGGLKGWHQIDRADADPVRLLGVLYDLFRLLPGFASPLVETMLANGEVDAAGAPAALEIMLQDLSRQLDQDFCLVLDDLYLLEGAPFALALLGQLLRAAPAGLKLILISRGAILPLVQADLASEEVVCIGNAELAMKRSEVAALFTEVLELPITTDAVEALQQATEGWVMGMRLLAGRAEGDGLVVDREAVRAILGKGQGAILDYFIAEVLDPIPAALRRALTRLALVRQFSLELAEHLSEVEGIDRLLADLLQRNFFIRCLDPDQKVFAFHHLFRDHLRLQLEEELPPDDILRIEGEIAAWYLQADQHEKALHHFLRAKAYGAAQSVLQQIGASLNAQNRIVTLQNTLATVPREVVADHPWLAYYQGIVASNTDPPAALFWAGKARDGFAASGDQGGELMALLQILHYHMAVDSQYNKGRVHLERTAELFERQADRLSDAQTINAANILLIAYAILENDIDRADRYYDTGLGLVLDLDLKNLEAETRLARCYRNIFLGDHPACRQEIEQSLALLASPRVSNINKAMLLLAHLNLLVNEADHDAYAYRKRLCRTALGEEVFERSVFGAFVRLWDIDMYMARGEPERAAEELEKALGSPFAAASAHLRSQYLQYHGYLLACAGEAAKAREAVEESLALRAEVGSPFFESFNAALVGATYARLGDFDKAEALFARGLVEREAVGGFYARPTVLAHRTYWRLSGEGGEDCAPPVEELLGDLARHGFRQLWLCTPEQMTRLFAEAVRSGIEVEAARRLTAERYERAILDDGALIPLLRIRCLGGLEVACGPRILLRETDLSANQRQLLTLLLAAPELRIHQEEVQGVLWPEAPPAKARTSFDNLVSRLRKQLGGSLDGGSGKGYLVLQRGILCLNNCRVDRIEFESCARKGLAHVRRKEFWQGDNDLNKALQLWQGGFVPGVVLDGVAEQKRRDLLVLYLETVQAQVAILVPSRRIDEAIGACTEALRHEPLHEAITRTLYNLHVGRGELVQARKVLAGYGDALRSQGFLPEETADILDGFWSGSP